MSSSVNCHLGATEGLLIQAKARAKLRDTTQGKKIRKIDYQVVISDWYVNYYQEQRFNLPGQQWIHQHIESPMLAQRQTYLKPENFDKLLDNVTMRGEIKIEISKSTLIISF